MLLIAAVAAVAGRAQTATDARVTIAQGQVSIDRDDEPWAVSSGETVRAQNILRTGPDGYARLDLAGGSYFEVFANSRVGFRRNAGAAADLVDVFEGRARVHFHPGPGEAQQRVFTNVAVISAFLPATIVIAVDGNDMVRLDVLEGEVHVQHKLLPRSEPTIVRAVDAILIEPDEQISRRLDRGALYRCAIRLRNLINILTPGHSTHSGQPVEQDQLVALR